MSVCASCQRAVEAAAAGQKSRLSSVLIFNFQSTNRLTEACCELFFQPFFYLCVCVAPLDSVSPTYQQPPLFPFRLCPFAQLMLVVCVHIAFWRRMRDGAPSGACGLMLANPNSSRCRSGTTGKLEAHSLTPDAVETEQTLENGYKKYVSKVLY